MEDYKEEIRLLLQKYYCNAGEEYKKIQRTTNDILHMVKGVIPSEPISEHDIYELMKELCFEQEQKILTENVCTFEGDEKQGIPPEYEDVEVGRMFVWKLFEN